MYDNLGKIELNDTGLKMYHFKMDWRIEISFISLDQQSL